MTTTFTYKPSKVVDESASDLSIREVAVELLDLLLSTCRALSSERKGSPYMFFAYDFGGTIVKQVVTTQNLYYFSNEGINLL